MQIRSQISKTVKDYQNPKKKNHFSPSPIKRYLSYKSFSIPSSGLDNKENLHECQQAINSKDNVMNVHSQKRSKRPLQSLTQSLININKDLLTNKKNMQSNNIESTNLPPLFNSMIPLNKSKSQTQQPLEFKQDISLIENQVSDPIGNLLDQLTQKKRTLKQERKQLQEETKRIKTQESDQKDNLGVHIQDHQPIDYSRTEIQAQTNKRSDNSPIEATYQSAVSCLTGGMQYSGRWTQEEHDRFIEGLEKFGKDWRLIEEYIGSRTCAQIRSHAQKYFNKLHRSRAKFSISKLEKSLGKRRKQELPKQLENFKEQSTSLEDFQHTQQQQQQPNQPLTQQQVPQQEFERPFSPYQNNQCSQPALLQDSASVNSLQILISQREQICFKFLTKIISAEDACRSLIDITNNFHSQAMKSLQDCKCKELYYFNLLYVVDLCNRMVDERNLTQFICILLSKQVTVLPIQPSGLIPNQEILQHVHTQINSQDSDFKSQAPQQTARGDQSQREKKHLNKQIQKEQQYVNPFRIQSQVNDRQSNFYKEQQ